MGLPNRRATCARGEARGHDERLSFAGQGTHGDGGRAPCAFPWQRSCGLGCGSESDEADNGRVAGTSGTRRAFRPAMPSLTAAVVTPRHCRVATVANMKTTHATLRDTWNANRGCVAEASPVHPGPAARRRLVFDVVQGGAKVLPGRAKAARCRAICLADSSVGRGRHFSAQMAHRAVQTCSVLFQLNARGTPLGWQLVDAAAEPAAEVHQPGDRRP